MGFQRFLRMNAKLLAILIALLLSPITWARDFSIPSTAVYYTLQQDGSVLVHEEIAYALSGSFHELYIQLPTDLQVRNESGYCQNRQGCEFRTQYNEGYFELVLAGDYADEAVTAVFDYALDGEILEQQDAAQFFYKLWGDTWEKPVGNLVAIVYLPSEGILPENAYGSRFFVRPAGVSVEQHPGYIALQSPNHPAKTFLEVNT